MNCEHCGKPFEVRPYRARNGTARFCSRSCLAKARIPAIENARLAAIRGKIPANYARVKVICARCETTFLVSPSRVGLRKYCSQRCKHPVREVAPKQAKPRKAVKLPKLTILNACLVCGAMFDACGSRGRARHKYCSKRCRYESMFEDCICKTCNKPFRRNRLSKRSADYCSRGCIERHPCLLCGKIITGRVAFQAHGHSRIVQYCSKQCSSIANRTISGKTNYVVRGFVATIGRIGQIACERCGFADADGLTVHHIDRNRRNNIESNLVTLCGTCHALEHWSGSRKRKKDVRIATFMAKHAVIPDQNGMPRQFSD